MIFNLDLDIQWYIFILLQLIIIFNIESYFPI